MDRCEREVEREEVERERGLREREWGREEDMLYIPRRKSEDSNASPVAEECPGALPRRAPEIIGTSVVGDVGSMFMPPILPTLPVLELLGDGEVGHELALYTFGI